MVEFQPITLTFFRLVRELEKDPYLDALMPSTVARKQKDADKRAQELGKQSFTLSNGKLPRVEYLAATTNQGIHLNVGHSPFFSYITRTAEALDQGGFEGYRRSYKANGQFFEEKTLLMHPRVLGVVTALIIEDGKTVVTTKQNMMSDENLPWGLLGGYASMGDVEKGDVQRKVRVAVAALREANEEGGLEQQEMQLLGLRAKVTEWHTHGKSDCILVFTCDAPNLKKEDIEGRQTDKEINRLYVPYEIDSQFAEQATSLLLARQGYLLGANLVLAIDRWGESLAQQINAKYEEMAEEYFLNMGPRKRDFEKKKQIAEIYKK